MVADEFQTGTEISFHARGLVLELAQISFKDDKYFALQVGGLQFCDPVLGSITLSIGQFHLNRCLLSLADPQLEYYQ